MKIWLTEIKALEARTGKKMATWAGENVEAPTFELAQQWCDKNKGYLKVVGELVAEVPFENGKADFSKMVDYENIKNN